MNPVFFFPPPGFQVVLFIFSQAPPLARWQQRTHLCIVRQHLFEREEPQRKILSWAAAGIISSLGERVCCLSVCQLHILSTPSPLPTFSSCTPLSRRKKKKMQIWKSAQNICTKSPSEWKGREFPLHQVLFRWTFFLTFWVQRRDCYSTQWIIIIYIIAEGGDYSLKVAPSKPKSLDLLLFF